MQPFAITLFRLPFSLPTPQGRRAQQLKTRPECWIQGLHDASTHGIEAPSAKHGKPIQEGMPWEAERSEGQDAPPQMLIFWDAIVTFQPWYRLAGGHARY